MTTRKTYNLNTYLVVLFMIFTQCNQNAKDKKDDQLTDKDWKHESAIVNHDTIYYKTKDTANTPYKITDLERSDWEFIDTCMKGANILINQHISNTSIYNYTAKSLDELIDIWNADSSKFKCSGNYFVNCVGVAYGQLLIKTYSMKWKLFTDEDGTDYATQIDELNFRNFPLSSVLKAIEQKREGSLNDILLMDKREISELKKTSRKL